jgi:predicted DNA-binding transcriptional regulator AlpA
MAKQISNADDAAAPEVMLSFGEPPSGPANGRHMPATDIAAASNPRSELLPAKVLLTKAEVCVLMKLSSRSLDKLLGRREFPGPVRLGKSDYWSPLPVQHWLERKFAVQEAWRIS